MNALKFMEQSALGDATHVAIQLLPPPTPIKYVAYDSTTVLTGMYR